MVHLVGLLKTGKAFLNKNDERAGLTEHFATISKVRAGDSKRVDMALNMECNRAVFPTSEILEIVRTSTSCSYPEARDVNSMVSQANNYDQTHVMSVVRKKGYGRIEYRAQGPIDRICQARSG